MDFGHWLSAAAGRHPDRVAVEAPGESVTYRELLLRAVRAAGALHMRGVRRGEPVALLLEPGLPFVEALHGCLLLGAPAVPIDPRLAKRERDAVLREIEVRVERPMRGETGVFQLPDPPEREQRRARDAHVGHDRQAPSRSRSRSATSAPTRAASRRRWA